MYILQSKVWGEICSRGCAYVAEHAVFYMFFLSCAFRTAPESQARKGGVAPFESLALAPLVPVPLFC